MSELLKFFVVCLFFPFRMTLKETMRGFCSLSVGAKTKSRSMGSRLIQLKIQLLKPIISWHILCPVLLGRTDKTVMTFSRYLHQWAKINTELTLLQQMFPVQVLFVPALLFQHRTDNSVINGPKLLDRYSLLHSHTWSLKRNWSQCSC